jgi:adenylate cyclase
VLALNPRDQVAELYVERCRHMAVNPPPADWDGTFIMESK